MEEDCAKYGAGHRLDGAGNGSGLASDGVHAVFLQKGPRKAVHQGEDEEQQPARRGAAAA